MQDSRLLKLAIVNVDLKCYSRDPSPELLTDFPLKNEYVPEKVRIKSEEEAAIFRLAKGFLLAILLG